MVQRDLQRRVALILLQDAPRAAKRGLGQGRGGRACSPGAGASREPRHLLLELIGHEQELALREPPHIKLAEVLKLAVDLLLTDPRPPPDGEDEDGGADAGGVWACKVLEDREKLAVDLLLADPRPPPDGEDEDGGQMLGESGPAKF